MAIGELPTEDQVITSDCGEQRDAVMRYLLCYCVGVVLQTSVCSFFLQMKTGKDLNDSAICASVVLMRSETYGLQVKHSTLTGTEQCQTVDYICVNGPCCHGVHTLQSYSHGGLGSGPPESSIFFLSNGQVILATFVTQTEANIDICSTQVCSFGFDHLHALFQC